MTSLANSYALLFSSKAKKDLKRFKRDKKKIDALRDLLDLLISGGYAVIPENMRPHKLKGDYTGLWECHAMPDLLVIWEQTEKPKEVYVVRIGSHSDLF